MEHIKNIVIIFVLLFSFTGAYSQKIYVKEGSTGGGTSWSDATGNLKAAISSASSGTSIWVAAGTYYPGTTRSDNFMLKKGVKIYGGFPNSGNPGMSDRDYNANKTYLSGDIDKNNTLDAGNTYHVVYAPNNINANSLLDGFIITGGYAGGGSNDGGGLYLRNSNNVISNCIIENNYAVNRGAGAFFRNFDGVISDCIFRNNESNSHGGAIYMYGGSSPKISNCTISDNKSVRHGAGVCIYTGSPVFTQTKIINNQITSTSGDNDGGAMYIGNNANVSVTGGEMTNNIAYDDGGAVYIYSGTSSFQDVSFSGNKTYDKNGYGGAVHINSGNISFNNCTFTNNNASNSGGGAVYVRGTTSPNITNCTFDQNKASRNGGAIFSQSNGWTTPIQSNIFTNNICESDANSEARGGAIYLTYSAPDILNNTFTNNTASSTDNSYNGCGGAIAVYQQDLTISGNTFTGNTAKTTSTTGTDCGSGGAIYLVRNANAKIDNNQFINNKAHYGGAIFATNTTGFLVSNCTFKNNSVSAYKNNSGWGAAFFSRAAKGGKITQSTFTENKANVSASYSTTGYGGVVGIESNSEIQVYRCRIYNNSAERGGALFLRNNSNFKISNCLIYQNSATDGGAAYNYRNNNAVSLNNVYVNNTASGHGSALYLTESDPKYSNDIFRGNKIYLANNAADPFFINCDIEGGLSSGLTGPGTGNYTNANYSNCIDLDPKFSDADFRITGTNSPCIGKGNPATTVADFPEDKDFDGNKRVRGVVDIGAYETNNKPIFVSLPHDPNSPTDNPGPESVTMSEDNSPNPFDLTLYAIDLDNENLSWSVNMAATNGTAGVTNATTVASATQPQSNKITYVPNKDFFGSDNFKIQISDGVFTDVIQVNVTIESVNDPPVFTSDPVLNVKAKKIWSYNVTTNDADGNSNDITITCPNKPAGMIFSNGAGGTASFSWTPTDAQVSPPKHSVTIRATDGDGAYEDQTFEISVLSRLITVGPSGAYQDIQDAIDIAIDGEDKIVVEDGTYNPFDTKGKSIEIEGNSSDPSAVIIDAKNLGNCLNINKGTVVINGFTFQNGTGNLGLPSHTTEHSPADAYYGGGILCLNAIATFENIVVKNCKLTKKNNNGGSGGGMYIANNSVVTINNAVVQDNSAEVYRGGGICIDDSQITLSNVQVKNNYAGNYGGGIGFYNSEITASSVNVTGNKVDGENKRGGGVYRYNSTLSGHINTSGNTEDNIYRFP